MPKDARGITIKVGDEILFNGCTCTVEKINESGLVGSTRIVDGKAQAVPIPAVLELSMKMSYATGSPISNVLVLGTPKDVDLLERKNKSLGVN